MFYIYRVLLFEILLAPDKALEGIKLTDKSRRHMKLIAGYLTHVLCMDFNRALPVLPNNEDVIVEDSRITEPHPTRAVYGSVD